MFFQTTFHHFLVRNLPPLLLYQGGHPTLSNKGQNESCASESFLFTFCSTPSSSLHVLVRQTEHQNKGILIDIFLSFQQQWSLKSFQAIGYDLEFNIHCVAMTSTATSQPYSKLNCWHINNHKILSTYDQSIHPTIKQNKTKNSSTLWSLQN